MVTITTESKPTRIDEALAPVPAPAHNGPFPTHAHSSGHSDRRHGSHIAHRVTHALGGRRTAFAASFGSVVTAMWITLFTLGLSIPTKPYRDRLLNLADPKVVVTGHDPTIIESLVVIAFAYTPTNLVMLCMVSALAGCLGRLATTDDAAAELARHHKVKQQLTVVSQTDTTLGSTAGATTAESTTVQQTTSDSFVSPMAPAITAITWGFFIYLVIVSGTVVLTGDPFKDTSPEQYLRLAGSASLLAFAVGWKPQILGQLVSNIGSTKFGKTS